MSDRLVLLLPILIVVLAALFFLFTMSVSIFLILVVFTSVFREYAANSMWIALIPPSIITILFLQKVLGRIYDMSYVSMTHSKADINTNSSQRQGK
ncbi:MAG TPA: hypothetical protein VFJ51_13540 [Nitrososphaeraceae archaeon]|nr:hypothetical protein [Nitrososphaeraceae archaeon]